VIVWGEEVVLVKVPVLKLPVKLLPPAPTKLVLVKVDDWTADITPQPSALTDDHDIVVLPPDVIVKLPAVRVGFVTEASAL